MITSDLHPEIVYDETPDEIVVKIPKKLGQTIICMDMNSFCTLVETFNTDVLQYQRSRRIALEKAKKEFDWKNCPRQPMNGLNNLIINNQRNAIYGSPNYAKLFVDGDEHVKKVYGAGSRSNNTKTITNELSKLEITKQPKGSKIVPNLATQAPIQIVYDNTMPSMLNTSAQMLTNVPVVNVMEQTEEAED